MSEVKIHPEYQYLSLLEDILKSGAEKKDHNTGIGLKSVFGRQIRFDLSEGFPLLTTKKVYWSGVLHELYWFLSGQSNIKYLVDNKVHIWDDYPYKIYEKAAVAGNADKLSKEEFIGKIAEDDSFAEKWGELPRIYGELWRRWPASDGRKIDQLAWIVDNLRKFPHRKSTVLSAWIPEYLYSMAEPGKALNFPLCHILIHFNIAGDKLSVQLYQRSADMFLGVPFNIASYSLLAHVIAQITGYKVADFVHTFGDAHIYENHMDAVKEQLSRTPKALPTISIDSSVKELEDFRPEHVTLSGYDPHPRIQAELTIAGGFDEKDRRK
jgi:thymidylate synthase